MNGVKIDRIGPRENSPNGVDTVIAPKAEGAEELQAQGFNRFQPWEPSSKAIRPEGYLYAVASRRRVRGNDLLAHMRVNPWSVQVMAVINCT